MSSGRQVRSLPGLTSRAATLPDTLVTKSLSKRSVLPSESLSRLKYMSSRPWYASIEATRFSAMAPMFTDMSPVRISYLSSGEYRERRSPVSLMYILNRPVILLSSRGMFGSETSVHGTTMPAFSSQFTAYAYSSAPSFLPLPSMRE